MRNFKLTLIFSLILILLGSFILECKKEPKTIKIGAILPLTGDLASFGQHCKNGMDIAIEEVNKKLEGKIKIKVIYEDDQNNANLAVSAMNKLIDIEKVPAVIGGIASSIALAEVPIANAKKVVLMCAFASSPKLTKAGEYKFRIMPSDDYQGIEAAEWITKLGFKKVAIIYTHNDWGIALKDAFVSNFVKLGGEIIYEEGINPEEKDFRSVIAKIKTKNPEAIFVPTYPREGAIIVRQIKEAGIKAQIFGGDPWANRDFIIGAGKAAEGIYFTAPLQYQGKEFQEFAEIYKKKYGEAPDLTASAGYDALKIIAFSIEKLIEQNKEITGSSLKEVLRGIKDFPGATGFTTFDEDGDVIGKPFGKMVIKNGKPEIYQEQK